MHIGLNLSRLKREILFLALPAIAEQTLLTITQIVDMIMVGRLGAEAVAAVGFSMQPTFFGNAIFAAISVGAVALISRFIGANEQELASKVLGHSLLVSIFVGSIFSIVVFLTSEKIIVFLGGEPEVISLGTSYLKILTPSFLFMLLSLTITSAMRGVGDTTLPMKINVFVNILNILGNYILIFGKFGFPALGVNGAAISTTISRIIGAIMLFFSLYREKSKISISLQDLFPFDISLVSRIMNIGIPASMEHLTMRIAIIFYVKIVSSLGTTAYAAHQIAINAESISYMPGFGLAIAATTLVGQNLGANKPKRAEVSVYESLKIGAIIMGVMGLVLFIFPKFLMTIYTDDPEIIQLGATCLRITAFEQIPMAVSMIITGGLRGAGDTKFIFYVTLFSTWLIRVVLSYITVVRYNLGLSAAWIITILDWFVRAILLLRRFKQGDWKNITV